MQERINGAVRPTVLGAVDAHNLRNSSAIVAMGITTVLHLWGELPDAELKDILVHMARHATAVDDGVKLLTDGHESDFDPDGD